MKRARYSDGFGGGDGLQNAKGESIDELYRRLVGQDDGALPLPPVGADLHLLTSRVRKYYFEAVIKLLCVNYESSQKLLGKNLRLPSAIWRCAKYIELQAVQACMLMQLYRQNIIAVIKQLKSDTEKGKLFKKLFECLLQPSTNDKGIQVNLEPKPNIVIKKRKRSLPECKQVFEKIEPKKIEPKLIETVAHHIQHYQIPVVVNVQAEHPVSVAAKTCVPVNGNENHITTPNTPCDVPVPTPSQTSKEINTRLSIESTDTEDQVMLQMEKLFRTDETEDDIFDGMQSFDFLNENSAQEKNPKIEAIRPTEKPIETKKNDSAGPAKSLDERIEMLKSVGALESTLAHAQKESPKQKKTTTSKWICELYFQKLKLSETLDQIIETNRRKHDRIKQKFIELFGEDDDDELIMSPLEETHDFISSCNERIAPYVVKSLMPYYNKGRIKTKALFKGVAKHIIDKIIACNRFPDEYEVYAFITEYLKERPVIRCNADYNF